MYIKEADTRKIVVALSLAFILVSCDTGGMGNKTSNPLIGTWEWQDESAIERFEFSEKEAAYYYERKGIPHSMANPSTDKGTYEYTDTKIIFEWEMRETLSADYIISGGELTMTHNATGKVITYIKK